MVLKINKNDVTGVISNEGELQKVAEWLNQTPAPLHPIDDSRPDRVLFTTVVLSDGRVLSATFGIGDWIWIRPQLLAVPYEPTVPDAGTVGDEAGS